MSPAGVAFRRSGSGPPIVLIHGIGGRAQAWNPLRSLMAKDAELIAIDLPGFNGTSLGDVVPTVSGYADAVEGVIRQLRLDRPTIAGSSLGGAIALELGRRGVAGRIVAFAPIGFWGLPGALWCRFAVNTVYRAAPLTARLLPLFARFSLTRLLMLIIFYGQPKNLARADVLADFQAFKDAAVLARVNNSMTRYRFVDGYPDIPIAVAWGSRDLVLPPFRQARRCRRLLPRAAHIALSGCGHIPMSDDPESCRAVLLGRYR